MSMLGLEMSRWLDAFKECGFLEYHVGFFSEVQELWGVLKLFGKMIERKEVWPDEASLVSVLTACANFRRLEPGRWIQAYIQDNGIKTDELLSTALLTMYAKCGVTDLARKIFYEMPNKSGVLYNSLIRGYSIHGQVDEAIKIFTMEKRGPKTYDTTFLCVLSACVAAGMILEGWWYFNLMHQKYKIEPKSEHFGCTVDLLDQTSLASKRHTEAEPTFGGTLVSAFRNQLLSEVRVIVAKQLIKFYPDDIAPYLLLSNIYAAEGKWHGVENVRRIMKDYGLESQVHYSSFHLAKLVSGSNPENLSLHRRDIVHSMLCEMGAQMKLHWADSKRILVMK